MAGTYTLPGVLLPGGLHSARPAASTVANGALYPETDTGQTYQSNGSSWTAWGAPAGVSGPITSSAFTMSTAKLLGRSTAGTGAIEQIAVGSGLALSAGTLSATGSGGGGALALLEHHTASSSASLDFTAFQSATYHRYLFQLLGLIPDTNAVDMEVQFSTDGGSTWHSGGSDYYYHMFIGGAGGAVINASGSAGVLNYNGGGIHVSSNTAYGYHGDFSLTEPVVGTAYPRLYGKGSYLDSEGSPIFIDGVYSVSLGSAGATVNGVRWLFSSGNIADGIVLCYGLAES